MCESLPGYDAWKTAYPPEYDVEFEECDRCGVEIYPDDPRYDDDEWGIICQDCWFEGGV